MASDRLRIGTRKSAMAIAQTEEIARRLNAVGTEVEIVKFETTGDTDQVGKLLPHGGKGGAFVAQIREAVLNGRLHAAMHSLKDVPGNEDTPGLVIGATLSRDPPGDVLVLRPGTSVDELKRTRGKGFRSAPTPSAAPPMCGGCFRRSRSSISAAPPTAACASLTRAQSRSCQMAVRWGLRMR
jgi:Porphobilinogen deaminase